MPPWSKLRGWHLCLTRGAPPPAWPEVVGGEVHAKFPMFRCSTMRGSRERAASGRTLVARSTSPVRHWNGPFVVILGIAFVTYRPIPGWMGRASTGSGFGTLGRSAHRLPLEGAKTIWPQVGLKAPSATNAGRESGLGRIHAATHHSASSGGCAPPQPTVPAQAGCQFLVTCLFFGRQSTSRPGFLAARSGAGPSPASRQSRQSTQGASRRPPVRAFS